jgi:FkbM family methyltransferase
MKSLWDGSFVIKAINRLSHTKYVPAPDADIDRYIAEHCPNDFWKSLSSGAREVWVKFHTIFEKFEIRTIVYVGAHIGTTALRLDDAFPEREFYLFEPVPQAYEKLVDNTIGRRNMRCFKLAAGSQEGRRTMFVDSFLPASSLLPYEAIATQEFPFLGNQTNIEVNIRPLDSVLHECKVKNVDLLLMDVQGYEDEVLRGAAQALASCKVVISELSLEVLYVRSATFDSLYQTLMAEGFRLRYLINPMEGASHRVLQIDGIFVRK